jgi:ABC-type taurine transport system substrate-binding protein
MLCRVALVLTDVSEELVASIARMTRIGDLGRTLAVTSNRSTPIFATLMMETIRSSETLVLSRATLHNIPEDGNSSESVKSSNLTSFLSF